MAGIRIKKSPMEEMGLTGEHEKIMFNFESANTIAHEIYGECFNIFQDVMDQARSPRGKMLRICDTSPA